MGRLLEIALRAGVSHFVYVSIVGIDRAQSYPYYRVKLETERVVEGSPIPHTILRATQFHDLVLIVVRALARLPLMPVPKRLLGQPVDSGEVADRMVELALSEPAGRAEDVGGPETRAVDDVVRAYLKLTDSRKRTVPAFRRDGSRDPWRRADVTGEQVRPRRLGRVPARRDAWQLGAPPLNVRRTGVPEAEARSSVQAAPTWCIELSRAEARAALLASRTW